MYGASALLPILYMHMDYAAACSRRTYLSLVGSAVCFVGISPPVFFVVKCPYMYTLVERDTCLHKRTQLPLYIRLGRPDNLVGRPT